MIQVRNRQNGMSLAEGEVGFYVGRPTALGNQSIVGRDGSRDEVIANYRAWLGRQIEEHNQVVTSELAKVAHFCRMSGTTKVTLFCWCWPKSCHADVIAEVVQRFLDTGHWSV